MFYIPPAIERSKELVLLWAACVSPKKVTNLQVSKSDIERFIEIIEAQETVSIHITGNLLAGLSNIAFRQIQLWAKDVDRLQDSMNRLALLSQRFNKSKKKGGSKNNPDNSLILKNSEMISFGVTSEDLEQINRPSKTPAAENVTRMNEVTMVDLLQAEDPMDLSSPLDGDGFGGEMDLQRNFFDSGNVNDDPLLQNIRLSFTNSPNEHPRFSPPMPIIDDYDDDFYAPPMDPGFRDADAPINDVNAPLADVDAPPADFGEPLQFDNVANNEQQSEKSSSDDTALTLQQIPASNRKRPQNAPSSRKRKLCVDPFVEIIGKDFRAAVRNPFESCYQIVELPNASKTPMKTVDDLFHEPVCPIRINWQFVLYFESPEKRKISRRRITLYDEESQESPRREESPRNEPSPIHNDPPINDFEADSLPHPSPPPPVDDYDFDDFGRGYSPLQQEEHIEVRQAGAEPLPPATNRRSNGIIHQPLFSPEFQTMCNKVNDSSPQFFSDLIGNDWGISKVVQFFARTLEYSDFKMEQEYSFTTFNPILILRATS